MTHTSDVVVVGGGIAGLTVALACSEEHLSVLLVGVSKPGEASRASAGMLAPSLEGLTAAAQHSALEARDEYPSFLSALFERTGIDVRLDRRGIIRLALHQTDLESWSSAVGAPGELVDARGLAALEPALEGHPGALFYPLDGAVDNVSLMSALDTAVAATAAIQRHTEAVVRVLIDDTGAAAITPGGQRFTGRFLVLAAGAWAGDMAGLPRPVPVRPLRGQMLRLDALPVGHVIYGGGGYLVPRNRSILVGATSEESGFDSRATPHGLDALREIAGRTIASLARAEVIEHWAGLRPVTPDGLPILGPDPQRASLIFACGYSRNGILFAPWAARRLAKGLVGELGPTIPTLFGISRFGI